jgi:hypothetical protein
MPTTRELLQELQYDGPGWNIDGTRGLLYYLNQAHRYMMSGDCEHHIRVDTSTGKPPTLDTIEGQIDYEMPDDCRKLFLVAIDAEDTLNNYYNANRDYTDEWYVRSFKFREHPYWEVAAQSTFALANANARLQFVHNPGETSDLYHIFYYVKPTEILSDSIQVQVPEIYHDILLDGVMARIGLKEYGDRNNYEYWKREIVAKIYWKEMNNGLFAKTRFVPQRPC